LPEAERLSGQTGIKASGEALQRTSGQAVLVTGTHDDTDQVTNHLFHASGWLQWHWPRLPHSYHGSGCTLASSIACLRAHGQPLQAAVAMAQQHVHDFLRSAFRPGRGQYVPNRNVP
ncbi:MAG: bifunctional hydroxymethylpyrimidine kinase/phosphomethylpyrimidine kinase, partial [Alcanivorax sp.]|nr:bifunctional hydroxymethylpyrimidine kinase/phosphomethylpyrimidine kinase [Alcanivorax sp.]